MHTHYLLLYYIYVSFLILFALLLRALHNCVFFQSFGEKPKVKLPKLPELPSRTKIRIQEGEKKENSHLHYHRVLCIIIKGFITNHRSQPPRTLITETVPMFHENAMKSDERTNCVVRFEGSFTMLDCQRKCQIPQEVSLLIGH